MNLSNKYCEANKENFAELNKIHFKNGKSLMLPNYKYFIIRNDRVDTTNFLTGNNLKEIKLVNKEWEYANAKPSIQ